MEPATLTFLGTIALILERTVDKVVTRITSDKARARRVARAAKKEARRQANTKLAGDSERKARAMEAQLKADIETLRRSRLGELERMRDQARKPKG